MSKNKTNSETTETPSPVALTVDAILAEVGNAVLREELYQAFFLRNPLDYAKLLNSREVSDDVKRRLLWLKVTEKPPYRGPDIGPLIEATFAQLWAKLAEQARQQNNA